MANCCCTKTLNFCEADVCSGEIDFDILAQSEGVHKLITHFKEVKITIEKEFEVGEEIIFPINNLNEDFQFTSEIYDPAGNKVIIRKNNIDYDCFVFKTTLNIVYS